MPSGPTYILGLSCFYHDSAACLLRDGEVIAAAQEERFTRVKHDASFPTNAIKYCLNHAQISLSDVNFAVYYEKPFIKFERLLETYFAYAPKGFSSFVRSMPTWVKTKLFLRHELNKYLAAIDGSWKKRSDSLLFTEHHISHAASAFYPSPFDRAIVLTADGVGEWATTSLAVGQGNNLSVTQEILFPHSLGLLYSAFTYYCGFRVNSGEYKLMGLAPYGQPKYVDIIKDKLIDIKSDGSFRLNMEYFGYCTSLRMINRKFEQLFGATARSPESDLTQQHMDLARSVQEVTEEVILKMTTSACRKYNIDRLCLAGGVALNCVANGRILRETPIKHLWIQPAAGDAGGALGAAFSVWHEFLGKERIVKDSDKMQASLLGPQFSTQEILKELEALGAIYHHFTVDEVDNKTVDALVEEKVIGWFQGRMEFGPRALGARSIIGDPRSARMQSTMNLKIKFRESFRPFAPSVLAEEATEWFEVKDRSPYMLIVAPVAEKHRIAMTNDQLKLFGIEKLNVKRSTIPAVTHVDYSARVQTVDRREHPRYWQLLHRFKHATGCPVLVNTSFNVRGEPIVCTPTDAFKCFMRTEMDMLVIENFVLYKHEQSWHDNDDWRKKLQLD